MITIHELDKSRQQLITAADIARTQLVQFCEERGINSKLLTKNSVKVDDCTVSELIIIMGLIHKIISPAEKLEK